MYSNLKFFKRSKDLNFSLKFFMRTSKFALIAAVLCFLACTASISLHDHYAYTQATSLKVDSLKLMDRAVEDYSMHEDEVDDILTKIEKAHEYEKARPKNDETIKMWEILKDPDKDLLGGFFKMWKEKGKVSQFFIEEKKKQIVKAFDEIIELESAKLRE